MSDYKQIAKEARIKIVDMIFRAQTSHVGSNLSCVDILTVLFEKIDLSKDKILFSKGWIAASAYYFLAEKGIIPKKDLERFCQPNEKQYIGLVEPSVKGIDFAGGSVGYGISAGVGFALAKKAQKQDGIVYVLESDGAMDVGMNWEAARIAADNKLDNLVVIVDCNGFQAMKPKQDDKLRDKWLDFGWLCNQIDGHDFNQIEFNFDNMNGRQPHCWIANTIKGKGVKRFEGNNLYHYKNLSKEEYEEAVKELCQI